MALITDKNERQKFYDSHNITGSTTIREGTGYKRYTPVDGGGFKEDPEGSVVMITDRDGDVQYKFIDKIVPSFDVVEESPKPLPRPGNLGDPEPGYGNEFDIQKDFEDEFPYGDEFDVPEKIQDDGMPDPPTPEPGYENEFDDQEKKNLWEKIKEAIGLNHGGLMSKCDCGLPECMNCGSMMEMGVTVGVEPKTGNPIPAGSNAENVKDDIPAALSTGEYVLPADVVRWHGLNHIQGMIDEAKMGLMAMHTEGYIHDIEVEKEESDSEESSSDDVSTKDSSPEEGEETSVQEEIETPEGNIIEVAEVVVEEDPKKKSRGIFGINSTPKIVY